MTEAKFEGMDARHERAVFDFLEKLMFEILLRTDGRTTDILETILDDKMTVRVLSQEQIEAGDFEESGEISGAPYYRRESILISEKSNFVVSHNIALVCSKYVPAPLFEALTARQEGIGKAISRLGLQTSRRLADSGWRSGAEPTGLFQKPFKPYFSPVNAHSPYKKYCIYFDTVPGIHMIEYFNPQMIRHRLNRFMNEQHG
ncbi:4-hydroxybenzoate synthetase [Paenibacillus mesophilus]|uniref:4-hydroxybenzoate synthetase n=1 Tax=Paenibacillus mesophilus TaxID=2582849 RepID=UPI00110E2443|nr:4-hydroxybenzoate synthetase [Paenibacillus mesophilus]TMV53037.1 4-hydroxybenzoate synthetase [Paenibacillus mesophilus]